MATDYYRISLEILHHLLKDAGDTNWTNSVAKNIEAWDTERNAEQHLRSYGGSGALNDIIIGDKTIEGVWTDKLFYTTQKLATKIARKEITTAPLDEAFYVYGLDSINGWHCQSCNYRGIDELRIEDHIATIYLPKVFIELIKQDALFEITDLKRFIDTDVVAAARKKLMDAIRKKGISITNNKGEWIRVCPSCITDDGKGHWWQITIKELEA